MWTENDENHIIAMPRRNCFEGDLPSACYHHAMVGPNLSKRSFRDSGDREGFSRGRSCPVFSVADKHYVLTTSLRIDRLHRGLENILSVLPSQSVCDSCHSDALYRLRCQKCSSYRPLRDGPSSVCISSFMSSDSLIK